MGNKTKGLLALLGLGAIAYWKYKNSSEEDKQMVKDKINTAKDNLNKWGNDLKDKANNVASQVKDKANDVASQAQDKAEDLKNKAQEAVS
ncbi:MAG: YtxH domain-containing protein [Chlorobi bacterium]|jgi:gas vesicle protein|uniref:YtxH domain-containing protein n=2 Tax=Chryseobacterium TaxID=59732 RepID=A0AAJ1R5N9_9FLAO|nr:MULTISPECIES: YtxH domain-containing protein [Chryseobacterium]NPA10054.1 YtxH domain-containing protein [Chlorobiota bacterium]MCF2218874.1 YtxH domain-containing protein [Chryseobacterium sp. PS-8]MDN4012777.1 YtxH domain-containing protein [Chryseobacterium gambrini]MDN4030339.1 YtxH domain-containing protein [Chryseobacterium gambrini]QWA39376.1 YtxH domain-containing protein [Chryseobacterium sp. ZHDP1]